VTDVDEYFEKQKQKEYEARLDEEEQKVIRELDEYLSFEGIFFKTAEIREFSFEHLYLSGKLRNSQ